MNRLGVKVIITLSALLVIAARLIWPDAKVDTVTVAVVPMVVSTGALLTVADRRSTR